MSLTPDQVLALATDASSVAAGRKAANPRDWSASGHDDRALWGKCQGSALYTVLVDLADNASKCSCPSRKFPCKHALGLLLLHATGAVPAAAPPTDVATWIAGRTTRAAKKTEASEIAFDADAARARESKRLDGMVDSVTTMQRWLADLVRDGLTTVEASPPWERQAARLVDAKAPGLAGRVRALAEHVGGNDDWPARLLDEMGLLALLGRAVRAHATLPPELAAEVRVLAGVPFPTEEVLQAGPRVADDWWIAGQSEYDDTRIRTQRAWLVGANTGTVALVLQFAPGSTPYPTPLLEGTGFAGTLAFFPGGERALVVDRTAALADAPMLPGPDRVEGFLAGIAGVLARRPWLVARAAVLRGVVPVRDSAGFWLVDADGDALPVLGGPAGWLLLALSGGHPVDLVVEWGPDVVTLLSVRDGARLVSLRAPYVAGGGGVAGRVDPLVRAALVGLQNGGELPEPVGEAETLVASLPALPPADALLLRAGARALERRAGCLVQQRAIPAPCPVETAPVVPDSAVPVLREVFQLEGGLDSEALRLVAARGRVLPPALLPSALGSGADPALIRAVLGARGAWLLSQNRTWSERLDKPDVAALVTRVETGARPERVAALTLLRGQDPARGRSLVEAALATDAPDVRLALLDALGPARAEDEPLFTAALSDRSAGVRERAAERLAALPGSALAARAAAALAPYVQLGEALAVEPPEAFDPAWGKDALVDKPPKGVGARAWWLVQLVGRVPPAAIFAGKTPEAALSLVQASEWREPMVAGLLRGALLAKDSGPESAAWLAALFPFAPPGGDALRPDRLALVKALPAEEAERRVARFLREPDGASLLGALPTPWSADFARSFINTLRVDPAKLRLMSELAARALPPSTFDALLQLRADPAFAPHKRWLDPMCATVELRNRLHLELSR